MAAQNRTMVHICLWIVILIGICLLFCFFFLPQFIKLLPQIADVEKPLPAYLRVVFNANNFLSHYGWFAAGVYAMLLGGIIFWDKAAKSQGDH